MTRATHSKLRALGEEAMKRLPHVLIVFAVLLLWQGWSNARSAQANAVAAKQTAVDIKKVVKSQDQVLRAITKNTDDGNKTAQKQTAIIICMLQVPISQRTTDLLNNCRKQVEDIINSNGDVILPQPISPSNDPSASSANSNTPTDNAEQGTPVNRISQPSTTAQAQLQVRDSTLCAVLNIAC